MRCWNESTTTLDPSSCAPSVKIEGGGLAARSLRAHPSVGVVQATRACPNTKGQVYFEVEVLSSGENSCISVGFAHPSYSLNKHIGWLKGSYGYHGDDGKRFSDSGFGTSYGPTFGTGDIVGAGIDFNRGTAFFTKNGRHLGTAFQGLSVYAIPSVGFRSQGAAVKFNFAGPFRYHAEESSYGEGLELKCLKAQQGEQAAKTENERLRAQVSALQQLEAKCLQAHQGEQATKIENERLRAQVTDLQQHVSMQGLANEEPITANTSSPSRTAVAKLRTAQECAADAISQLELEFGALERENGVLKQAHDGEQAAQTETKRLYAQVTALQQQLTQLVPDESSLAKLSLEELQKTESRLGQEVQRLREAIFARMAEERESLTSDKLCSLCCERTKALVFNCGHQTCDVCGSADKMPTCPFDRKPITTRIKLYNT